MDYEFNVFPHHTYTASWVRSGKWNIEYYSNILAKMCILNIVFVAYGTVFEFFIQKSNVFEHLYISFKSCEFCEKLLDRVSYSKWAHFVASNKYAICAKMLKCGRQKLLRIFYWCSIFTAKFELSRGRLNVPLPSVFHSRISDEIDLRFHVHVNDWSSRSRV